MIKKLLLLIPLVSLTSCSGVDIETHYNVRYDYFETQKYYVVYYNDKEQNISDDKVTYTLVNQYPATNDGHVALNIFYVMTKRLFKTKAYSLTIYYRNE